MTFFDRLMISQASVAGLAMGLLIFTNWIVLLQAGFTEFEARNRLLLLFVLLQNYHVFNCRSETESVFRIALRRNRVLVAGVLAAQGLHILAMHVPLTQRVLQISPITLWEWIVPFAMSSTILVAMELFKWWWRRRERFAAVPSPA